MRSACLCLLLPGLILAQDLGDTLDEALQRASGGGFWGSVLVAREGEVLLARGYGQADYLTAPNGTATLFELASLSKQITATAVLALVEDGELTLDTTLGELFRRLPEDKRGLTVAQLLHHTSGLSPNIGVAYSSPLDTGPWMASVLAAPLAATPGARFSYSNVGYALLAAIVEKTSGKSFEAYCKKRLFERAGLERTGFIGDEKLLEDEDVSARLAPGAPDWTAVRWHYGWGYRGMGGVVSCIDDLLRWDRALRGDKVLGEEARRMLFDPELEGYAGGWLVETTPQGTRKAHHSGSVQGYRTLMLRWLEEDACVVLLTNDQGDIYGLAEVLEQHLFPSPELRARLDLAGYALGPARQVDDVALAWRVVAGEAGVAVELLDADADHALATITLPAGYERKLRAELSAAIEARRRDDEGAPAAYEGGVYLGVYGERTEVELDEQLELVVFPQYTGMGADGERVVDKRVTLVLKDPVHRMWPVMVKMNVAGAWELLRQLGD